MSQITYRKIFIIGDTGRGKTTFAKKLSEHTGIPHYSTECWLKFKNIFYQYYYLIKRSLTRKNENLIDLWNLLKHVTYKKYKKRYGNHLPPLEELLKLYKNKVIVLNLMREINKLVNSIK